jgi:NAD(P)-dependent dehydrogenase (short-subunit alcohol dehydrogenase family)
MAKHLVVITGATKGLGRALAVALVRRGHEVVALGRDQAQLASLPEETGDAGLITCIQADLSTRDGVTAAIAAVHEATEGRATALINNAGVQLFAPVADFDLDQVEETLFVNVFVPFAMTQALLPELEKSNGFVINIASDLAYRPMELGSIYVASKFALFGMTQVMQEELRSRGVRLSLIEPGYIATGEYASERARANHMPPEDLADVLTWIFDTPDGMRIDRMTIHPMIQGTWGDISFPNLDELLKS